MHFDDHHDFEYKVPELRVSIDQDIPNRIWDIISELNITLDEISTFIGANFKSLCISGHGLPENYE